MNLDTLSGGLGLAACVGSFTAIFLERLRSLGTRLVEFFWCNYYLRGAAGEAFHRLRWEGRLRPFLKASTSTMIMFGRPARRKGAGPIVKDSCLYTYCSPQEYGWYHFGWFMFKLQATDCGPRGAVICIPRFWPGLQGFLREIEVTSLAMQASGGEGRRAEGQIYYLTAPRGQLGRTVSAALTPAPTAPGENPGAAADLSDSDFAKANIGFLDKGWITDSPIRHSSYAMPPGGAELLASLMAWSEARDFYLNRGIPWRTGVKLEGGPGNGKTSLIRELGRHLGCPVYVLDLASCRTNADLNDLLERTDSGGELRIVAFEDIDGVFEGRVNKTKTDIEPGVSFDHLLNVVDGAKSPNGQLLVLSTNHPERLDEALTRSGRIDHTLKIGPPTREAKLKIAGRILDFAPELFERVMSETSDDERGSDFEHRCLRAAEERLHADRLKVIKS